MDRDASEELEEIFSEAAGLDPEARTRLLDARCAGRPELRRDVESLLASHDGLGSFLHVGTVLPGNPTPAQDDDGARTGQVVAHYQLVERVAHGSTGVVFRAEDLALGRTAAIKLLPRSFDRELRRLVLAEAEATARLQHPAIATFYEAGEADGEAFIAMEFVQGQTLRARLRAGPIPVEEALSLTGCLLEALAHAHAAGLVHRDIKPENIVVVEPGFAKLLDFGIAVPLAAGDAPHAGTVGYLAPEQITRAPLDGRTDVFQVGAVLFEMLAGRPLFGGGSRLERLAAAMAPADLAALDDVVPAPVAAIVARAVAHDPGDRYGSASAFLRAVRAIDSAAPAAAGARVIAVAEFENQTGNEQLAWIASAVSDALHKDLAGARGLNTMPRLQFARAAAESDPHTASLQLGCGWLVDGGVRQLSRGALQIAARLVEVATGRVCWTRALEGPLDRLLDLQQDLGAALAGELKGGAVVASGASSRGTLVEAHEYFTRARLLLEGFGKGSFEDARELLERAIDVDPQHVEALATLAMAHGLRAIASPHTSQYEQAVAYADRALAVDSGHLRALIWKSYALSALGRHAEADVCTRRALEIAPRDTEALYFGAGNRLFWQRPPAVREALTLLQRAVESDETRGIWWLGLGAAHSHLGHDREALYCYTRARRLEGVATRFHTAGAAAYVAESLRRLGRLDEARQAAFDGLDAAERSDHAYRDTFRAYALSVIGRVALDQRQREAAEAAFQQVLAQTRGRPEPRATGHLAVQALCGLARATGRPTYLDEAALLFESRETFNFTQFYGVLEADTLAELARTAQALGRDAEARRWESRVEAEQ